MEHTPSISFPALLLLAGLGTGFLLTSAFSPSRPESVIESVDAYGSETVPARLWQDPFEAVYRYIEKKTAEDARCQISDQTTVDKHHDFNCLARQIQALQVDGIAVTVLAVMLPGSPYFEDTERRLRSRYATLAALAREGFVPQDSAFIDYIDNPLGKQSGIVLPRILPYEWYYQINSGNGNAGVSPRKILLLWLDEAAFSQNPLARLETLIEQLRSHVQEKVDYRVDFRLLGPSGSGTLNAISEETLGAGQGGSPLSQRITAISPSATVDRRIISDRKLPGDLFASDNFKFLRTILPDQQHSSALVRELERRNLTLTALRDNDNNHIVIISEWDTLYSRSLNASFCAAIAEQRYAGDSSRQGSEMEACYQGKLPHDWVHRFNYLRGIDGTVYSSKAVTSRSLLKETGAQQTVDIERPIQNNQFDYIRRLANQIDQLNHALKKQGDRTSIGAIGVMGSDVYDKLLILQALRVKYPGLLFFTVDLDARFTHPAEYPWTRNLIVASTFGLKPEPAVASQSREAFNQRKLLNMMSYPFSESSALRQTQPELTADTQTVQTRANTFPSFRDSYQTALFFATRLILAETPAQFEQLGLLRNAISEVTQADVNQLLTAKIHEVARSGFYPLSTAAETDQQPMQEIENDDLMELLLEVLLIFVLSYVLLYLTSETLNRWTHYRLANHREIAITILSCLVWLAILIALIVCLSTAMWAEGGEPFELLEGISTWPTALIRTIAALLAVYFYYTVTVYKLPQHRNRLFDKYIHEQGEARFRCHACYLSLHRWRSDHADREISITDLWREYRLRGHGLMRLSRTLILLVCYLVFVISVMRFFELEGPNLPTRGAANTLYTQITLGIAVFCMLFVIFFTADANQLCRRFITILSTNRIIWLEKPADDTTMQSITSLKNAQIDPETRSIWLSINMIADDTTLVSRMVYFPFFILFLMLFARLTIFDNWTTPPGLMLVLSLNFIFAFYSVSIMEKAANLARHQAVERLAHKCIVLQSQGREQEKQQVEQIRDYILSIRKGAFQPFVERPLVRAAVLPFATIGVTIFEYISLFHY